MYSTDQVRPSRVVASVRMPNLDVVIKDICAGCAKAGHEITEVLAAFIARTVHFRAMSVCVGISADEFVSFFRLLRETLQSSVQQES